MSTMDAKKRKLDGGAAEAAAEAGGEEQKPLKVSGLISCGSYGKVFVVEHLGTTCALKYMVYKPNGDVSRSVFMQGVTRELMYGRVLLGEHFKGHFLHTYSDGVIAAGVLQSLARGTLACLGTLSAADVCNTLFPVANVLAYLHSKGVMHRDLKPQNILQNMDGSMMLIDPSLACRSDSSTEYNVVTLWYRAPEILLGLEYTHVSDVWSLGIVLWDCHSGTTFGGGCVDEAAMLLQVYRRFGGQDFAPLTAAGSAAEAAEAATAAAAAKANATGDAGNAAAEAATAATAATAAPSDGATSANIYSSNPLFNDLLTNMLMVDPLKRFTMHQVTNHAFWRGCASHRKLLDGAALRFKPYVQDIHLEAAVITPAAPRPTKAPRNSKLTLPQRVYVLDQLLGCCYVLNLPLRVAVCAMHLHDELWNVYALTTQAVRRAALAAVAFMASALDTDCKQAVSTFAKHHGALLPAVLEMCSTVVECSNCLPPNIWRLYKTIPQGGPDAVWTMAASRDVWRNGGGLEAASAQELQAMRDTEEYKTAWIMRENPEGRCRLDVLLEGAGPPAAQQVGHEVPPVAPPAGPPEQAPPRSSPGSSPGGGPGGPPAAPQPAPPEPCTEK